MDDLAPPSRCPGITSSRLSAGADAAAGPLRAQLAPLADKLAEGSERAYAAWVHLFVQRAHR